MCFFFVPKTGLGGFGLVGNICLGKCFCCCFFLGEFLLTWIVGGWDEGNVRSIYIVCYIHSMF